MDVFHFSQLYVQFSFSVPDTANAVHPFSHKPFRSVHQVYLSHRRTPIFFTWLLLSFCLTLSCSNRDPSAQLQETSFTLPARKVVCRNALKNLPASGIVQMWEAAADHCILQGQIITFLHQQACNMPCLFLCVRSNTQMRCWVYFSL